jgi:hypothetical protein
LLATDRKPPDTAALVQDADDRRVIGQQTDLTVEGSRDHHLGVARPQLALGLDQLDVQRHGVTPHSFVARADPA